jgi:hypothetical protein
MQLHHKCSVLGAPLVAFAVVFGNMTGAEKHSCISRWGVIWACAYASSESGIDRVKRHHFFVQTLARYGHASSCGPREVTEHFCIRGMVTKQCVEAGVLRLM